MFLTSYEIDCVAEYIMNYLSRMYDMDRKRLILNSDGAKWIESLTNNLKSYNVIYIYDGFHLNSLLRTLSGNNSEIYYKLYNFLNEGDIEKFNKCSSLLI
ncbi:hypothetical protein EII29_05130 [Leptotrichia sp. OH3620_COT-345]|uniref:UPF0236 family transposase-like protein n=1 Tax=Leptotrichia sp. OH3620_COT-345 TaxID=2491048 RepID=UPI000F64BAEF|nr:UPF0236 family protein [Leptotrichia sp. OH3620_COT-345]RRD39905.1 hypothetical protein EII29_05130 [Leptotrichia sp. OH3620_COT-345]